MLCIFYDAKLKPLYPHILVITCLILLTSLIKVNEWKLMLVSDVDSEQSPSMAQVSVTLSFDGCEGPTYSSCDGTDHGALTEQWSQHSLLGLCGGGDYLCIDMIIIISHRTMAKKHKLAYHIYKHADEINWQVLFLSVVVHVLIYLYLIKCYQ